MSFARYVHKAHGGAVDVDAVGHFEMADDKSHQVGAHEHGVGKTNRSSPATGCAANLRSVRDGLESICDIEGDSKHGFVFGLVPTGEYPTAIRGLHLGRGDDLLGTVGAGIGTAVEPSQFVV